MMHHALEVQEILSVIFSYCPMQVLTTYRDKRVVCSSDLPALARTSRAFKEPALDLLWTALNDLSPLARCLPEASRRVSPENMYSFTRPLTQTEWDTLHSYTRRIRYIRDFNRGLDWKSVTIFLNPPTTAPLFPNLRILNCKYTEQTMSLMHLPLPSLVALGVGFENPHLFQNSLKLFPNFSPNIGKLSISVPQLEGTFSKFEPNYMCRWKTLWSVNCSQVALDVNALVHLSSMPELTSLTFAVGDTLPASDSPLVFPNLNYLDLQSISLDPISHLLSQTRLPVLTEFTASIANSPLRQELTRFLAGVVTSNTGHTIERLQLNQSTHLPNFVARSQELSLDFEDLRPCMAFSNLRRINLSVECNVDLTDSQVLTLASAWPKLDELLINEDWGWNSTSGITPGGLVQLLQTCRSLGWIALRLDTRGYTEAPANLGWTPTSRLSINVLDASIEEESVPAVTAFFCGLNDTYSKSGFKFKLEAWDCGAALEFPDVWGYTEHWTDILDQVYANSKPSDSDVEFASFLKKWDDWQQTIAFTA